MTAVNLMGIGVPPALAERLAHRTMFIPAAAGRAGATSGWTNAGDTGAALLPAGETGSTFVIPVSGLDLGDVVKSFKVIAQIESAGNTATLDASLRKLVNAAADPTDSSLGAITQVSATSDTAVSSSKTLATAEIVASGECLYVLVTGTTAASTDAQLLGVEIEVERFGVTA